MLLSQQRLTTSQQAYGIQVGIVGSGSYEQSWRAIPTQRPGPECYTRNRLKVQGSGKSTVIAKVQAKLRPLRAQSYGWTRNLLGACCNFRDGELIAREWKSRMML